MLPAGCRLQLNSEMYSAQLLDHFQNPRNAGEIADADATAEIENPACGDVLRLTLKAGAGRITGARFKAKGCVASIACGSALTELIVGKRINEAHELRREDVIACGRRPAASFNPCGAVGPRRAFRSAESDRKVVQSSCPSRTRRAASPACNRARPSFSPPLANSTAWSPARSIAPM